MDIRKINENEAFDNETGEKLFGEWTWRTARQKVKLFDVTNAAKNVKHAKFRTARTQKRLYDQLSLDEAGLLLKLMPYMNWETNLIVGDGVLGEKNMPLSWAKFDGILDCSKPHRIKLVKALEEKKVIGYMVVGGKKVGIVVNPKYAINGYKPAEALLNIFESEKDIFEDEGEDTLTE